MMGMISNHYAHLPRNVFQMFLIGTLRMFCEYIVNIAVRGHSTTFRVTLIQLALIVLGFYIILYDDLLGCSAHTIRGFYSPYSTT